MGISPIFHLQKLRHGEVKWVTGLIALCWYPSSQSTTATLPLQEFQSGLLVHETGQRASVRPWRQAPSWPCLPGGCCSGATPALPSQGSGRADPPASAMWTRQNDRQRLRGPTQASRLCPFWSVRFQSPQPCPPEAAAFLPFLQAYLLQEISITSRSSLPKLLAWLP